MNKCCDKFGEAVDNGAIFKSGTDWVIAEFITAYGGAMYNSWSEYKIAFCPFCGHPITWISVKDRYPGVKEGCLVAVVVINIDEEDPFPYVTHYDGKRERGFELLKVTHWMPLPPWNNL